MLSRSSERYREGGRIQLPRLAQEAESAGDADESETLRAEVRALVWASSLEGFRRDSIRAI